MGIKTKKFSQLSATSDGKLILANDNKLYQSTSSLSDILESNSGASYEAGQGIKIDNNTISINSDNCSVNRSYAFAEGSNTTAAGTYSHAEGSTTLSVGEASHAEGWGSRAYGNYSHAEGYDTSAEGSYSHAEGQQNRAANYAHAEGQFNIAVGQPSHAEGMWTSAIGNRSHTEGESTYAVSNDSHAEGYGTSATGEDSHSEGINTQANGKGSHAEGYNNISVGIYSHTEGGDYDSNPPYNVWPNQAIGKASHAEGAKNNAVGNYAHAEGFDNQAVGYASHTEGCSTYTKDGQAHAEGYSTSAIGYCSHAEGYNTIAYDGKGHAEGDNSVASGGNNHAECDYTSAIGFASHVEGSHTLASGNNSHVEGYYNSAYGDANHAEGWETVASGQYTHTEGYRTKTLDICTHAEGYETSAKGYCSHAEGIFTIAGADYMHAGGKYNKTSANAAFVIGNGTPSERSDAFVIYPDGSVSAAGKISANGVELGAGGGSNYSYITVNMPNITPSYDFNYVQIGNQKWMNSNLTIDDGGSGISAYTEYTDYQGNIMIMRNLYTYGAAKRIADSIPGWHLPTYDEVRALFQTLGDVWVPQTYDNYQLLGSKYGKKLKSQSAWHIHSPEYANAANGTDDYGFNCCPMITSTAIKDNETWAESTQILCNETEISGYPLWTYLYFNNHDNLDYSKTYDYVTLNWTNVSNDSYFGNVRLIKDEE